MRTGRNCMDMCSIHCVASVSHCFPQSGLKYWHASLCETCSLKIIITSTSNEKFWTPNNYYSSTSSLTWNSVIETRNTNGTTGKSNLLDICDKSNYIRYWRRREKKKKYNYVCINLDQLVSILLKKSIFSWIFPYWYIASVNHLTFYF